MTRGPFQPCQAQWHARCYKQGDHDKFPVVSENDYRHLGLDWDEDPDRFKTARDGDHLMCPFQCDLCHFRNIKLRDPSDLPMDRLLLLCIRRAVLDALWAREKSTVLRNRANLNKVRECAAMFGVDDPLPRHPPFPLSDSSGMLLACTILMKSLDKGRNSAFVQFETIRKLRSAYSNSIHALPGGTESATLMEGSSQELVRSNSPSNSLWFKRFMAVSYTHLTLPTICSV